MIENFSKVASHWSDFAVGFANTVILCVSAGTISLVLGMLFTLPLVARNTIVRTTSYAIVDGVRTIPFLMLAYLIYYVLPAVEVRLDSWSSGLLALVIYHTAYFSEILRGAWSHLPHEQEEAGRAFGYSGAQLFIRIIGPQIILSAGPVLGNQMIMLIKDSSFLMVITVPELTYKANQVQSLYYVPFETFIIAVALYWVLCRTVEYFVQRLEVVAEVRRNA